MNVWKEFGHSTLFVISENSLYSQVSISRSPISRVTHISGADRVTTILIALYLYMISRLFMLPVPVVFWGDPMCILHYNLP